jgi:hypothetical protein
MTNKMKNGNGVVGGIQGGQMGRDLLHLQKRGISKSSS